MQEVQHSSLPQTDKLFYLTTLAQGTFTYELFDEMQRKIHEKLNSKQKNIDAIRAEIEAMEKSQAELAERVIQLTPDAIQQANEVRSNLFEKAKAEIEQQMKDSEAKEIENIKQILKKKNGNA